MHIHTDTWMNTHTHRHTHANICPHPHTHIPTQMHAHIICNANGSVLHLAAGVPWWCICGAKENTRPQLCDPGLPAEPSRPSSCDPRRTGTNLCLLSLVPPSPTKHQSENKQCSCRMLCTNVSICFNINNRQMQHETAFLVQSA